MTKTNIMIVEDSGVVLLDIKKSLETLGYTVVATASSKGEAIRRADETCPDLILMDIRLGDDNAGIDAANYIREHFNIPIIFLTGYADEDTFQRAKGTDPFGYILKPFDPNGLRTTIEIALHNHELKSGLRESERRYRTLVETMNDGVAQADANGKIIYVNDKFCEMIGFPNEELIGREHTSLFPDEFQELQREEFANRKNGAASSFETALMSQDGSSIPVLLSGSPLLNQDGSFAGVIGIFTDITERKQVELELKESEERFRTIFDTEPECVKILKPDTTLVTMNAAGLAMIEAESLDMVQGQSVLPMIDEEFRDAFRELTDKVCKKGESCMLEFRMTGFKGTPRWLETHSVPLRNSLGEITSLLGVTRDITERKQTENSLRESEERMRRLASATHEGLGFSKEGVVVDVNHQLAQMLGYEVSELIGRSAMDFVAPKSRSLVMEKIKSEFEKPYEHHAIKKDGTVFPVEVQARMMEDQGRQVRVTAIRDISERKHAEEDFRAFQERFKVFFNSINDAIFVHPLLEEGFAPFIEVNDIACQRYGYSRDEFLELAATDITQATDVEEHSAPDNHKKLLKAKHLVFETVHIKKSGETFPVEINATIVDERGQPVILAVVRDITERKKSQQALQERETKLQSIFRAAPIGIGMTIERVIQEANRMLCQMTGYSRDELVGQSARMLYLSTKDYEYVGDEKYRMIQEPGIGTVETRWKRKDGDVRDILLSSVPLDPDDFSKGVTFAALDITERVQTENDLLVALAKYKTLFNAVPLGITVTDAAGDILESNAMAEKLLGLSQNEQTRRTIDGSEWRIVHSDGTPMPVDEYASVRALKEKHLVENVEMGIVKSEETTTWLSVTADLLPLEGYGVVIAYSDISDRKQAELAVKESGERYRNIVESSPLGMHVYALQAPNKLVFSGSNPAADEILGVDNSIFVDKTIEEAFPALVDTEVPERYKIAAKNGDSWKTEQIEYDSDGIKGAFEVVAFQTSPNNMVAMFHDITTRKRAEETLRTKTAELEALFSISAHLRIAQSADEMLPVVVAEMRRVLRSDANAVILLDADEEHFTYTLSDGSLAVNNGMQFSIENSISGMVLNAREPYITEDLSSDPRKTTTIQGDDNLGPAVLVPVISESEFLGVLLCARNKRSDSRPFAPSDVQLLKAIGEMVGNAFRRATLYDQAMTRLQHVQALHSIDMAISANLDLSVILDVLLTQGAAQLGVDAASLLLLNPHTHMLEFAASSGFRKKEIQSARLRLGEGLPGQVAMGQKVQCLLDLTHAENLVRKYLLDEGFVSYQAAPLIAKGQLQGVLEIFNRKAMVVSDEQTSFLETLATQAAIAIDNSQLFSDLQRSNFELEMAYDATIEGWSRALELRDQETEGHTLRVTDMTLRLAQMMGVRSEELIQVRRGALLHDIGKMGVPDRILLKPGKLDDEEWEIMRQHTVYAFEMLWPIEFLRPAIDIPHCHHERWDGSGYPRGLQGEQIPLTARIFAVVDVWDALNSDRPYRKAWTEDQALEYITANAGKHFDPQVVEQFLNFLNNNDQT